MAYEDRFGQVQRSKYDCLLFDLDDTLYPLSSGLAAACGKNIGDYMVEKLGIDRSKILDLGNLLYKNYGTTMAGLRAIGYDFDYDEYHSFVHGRLPYENLRPDPVLRSLLISLPYRKLIFTNADKVHAIKVLRILGLEDCFEGIICFETLNPTYKTAASDQTGKKRRIIMLYLSSTLVPKPPISYRTLSVCQTPQPHRKRLCCGCYFNETLQVNREQNKTVLHSEENLRRRFLLFFLLSSGISPAFPCFGKTKSKNPYDERRLLQQNKRIQKENNAPDDFPNFIREGFSVKVVASENYVTRDSGLILWDIAVGKGDCPKAGQQVTFHYVGYNESGRRIDSTYLQGSPAKVRMGTNALIPGFEEGLKDMKPGGKRRIIVPPELGPPVGPSTFFSSKQFEVFDVELLSIQDCTRRTIGFYSDVVCN